MERWRCLSNLALQPRVESHYMGRKPLLRGFWPKCPWAAARKLGSSVPVGGSLKGIILPVESKRREHWSGWAGLGICVGAWNWMLQSGRHLLCAWILQRCVCSHCQHSQCSRGAGVALAGTRGWAQSSSCCSSLVSPGSYGHALHAGKFWQIFPLCFEFSQRRGESFPEMLWFWCCEKQIQIGMVAGWGVLQPW